MTLTSDANTHVYIPIYYAKRKKIYFFKIEKKNLAFENQYYHGYPLSRIEKKKQNSKKVYYKTQNRFYNCMKS